MVDGWGLLHSLLADVIADVLGTASKEAATATAAEHDAWTLIASLAAEPARENCMGGRRRTTLLSTLLTRIRKRCCLAFWLCGARVKCGEQHKSGSGQGLRQSEFLLLTVERPSRCSGRRGFSCSAYQACRRCYTCVC